MRKVCVLLLAVLAPCAAMSADVPQFINYQGRLSDTIGEPLDTAVHMLFLIYQDSTGGTALWADTQLNVPVTNGLFSVQLGPVPHDLFSEPQRWLGIIVGTDPELSPRTALGASAYAYHTLRADTAGIALYGPGNGWLDDGSVVRLETASDKVGIGTANPQSELEVAGSIMMDPGEGNGCALRISENDVIKWALLFRPWDARRLSIYDDMANQFVMTFDSGTGNVGIGTTSPASKLEVAGDIDAQGSVHGYPLIADQANLENALIVQTGGASRFSVVANGSGTDYMTFRWIFGGNSSDIMTLNEHGRVGIGTTSPTEALDVVGIVKSDTVQCGVLHLTGGADVAEPFEMALGESVGPGMVVAIDPENPGRLRVSTDPYDKRVAGIVSGAGGVSPGLIMGQTGSLASGDCPVAMSGRVYCLADASGYPIEPGDLLTTSDVPGHAMKATDYDRALGAIIGKAMTSLDGGRGLVLVLVSLQ